MQQVSRILKLISFPAITFLFCLVYNNVQAQDTSITVSFHSARIKEALQQIENNSVLHFVFADAIVSGKARVSGNYKNASLASVLHDILVVNGITYVQKGKNIILHKSVEQQVELKGLLSGKITDARNGTPLIGVTIELDNLSVQTGMEGDFNIELKPGTYTALISYMGFKSITQTLSVKTGKETILTVTMSENANAINEVVITERKYSNTNIALIETIREARAVVNGISREQIARSQDRDAADVMRRVAGVSVMQNRFIVIRGMGQRYNAVLLNNAIAPSFEPDSRAFSFDIIPTAMIDRVMVYKTAVPELPGDFAGGVVKVSTTGIPAANTFNITYQASFRPSSTFRDFLGQPDGKYSWLGYDDGTYKKPIDYILQQGDDFKYRMDATRKFNKNWQAENKGMALPDQRLNLDFSKKLFLPGSMRAGIVGGLGYSYTKQYQVQYRNPKGYQGGNNRYTATDELYFRDVRLTGLVNLSLDINPDHHLVFKNLYTHLGSTRYMYRKGYAPYDDMAEIGIYPGENFEQFVMTNDYRGIYTGQLNGDHRLFNGQTKINWLAGYTRSDFYAPDERRRTHAAVPGTIDWGPWILSSVGLGTQGREQRIYMQGSELVKTLGLDIEQKINIGAFGPLLKAGFYWEDKSKSFAYSSFAHIDSALVGGAEGGFNMYEAYNILKAGYLAAEIPFLERFRLYGGIRIEDNLQHMGTSSRDVTGPNVGPVLLNLKKTTPLPSVNLSYNFTDKVLIRAAWYKTLNRPEFREISNIQYYDMANNSYVYGNTELLPQADIQNIDLRLEHYPGAGEMITFALFYKKIMNPYELYAMSSTSGVAFIWRNSEMARNYGAEVDIMLGMARYFKSGESRLAREIQKVSLLFNAAYIYSRLELGTEQRFQQYIDHRPLMGQSPYLLNVGINYTDDSSGFRLNVSYNTIGKRIAMVGNSKLAAVWELPRHSLDITFSKRISKNLELKGGIQNILNSRIVFAQDMNMDGRFDIVNTDYELLSHKEHDNRFQSWYDGAYYSLGIGFRL